MHQKAPDNSWELFILVTNPIFSVLISIKNNPIPCSGTGLFQVANYVLANVSHFLLFDDFKFTGAATLICKGEYINPGWYFTQ